MKIQSFLAGGLIAGLMLAPAGQAYAFSDTANHWALNDISRLTALDAIGGYEDASFRPDNTITRAEFSKILCKSLALPLVTGQAFSDTASHWASGDISTLIAQKILLPAEYGGVYAPDTPITRSEIAVMLVRAHGLDEKAQSLAGCATGFADDKMIADYNKGYLALARQLEFIGGYEDGTFRPQATATRAEASAMIVRFLDAQASPTPTPAPSQPTISTVPPTTTTQADALPNGLQLAITDLTVSAPQTTNSLGEQTVTTTFTLSAQNAGQTALTLSAEQLHLAAIYNQSGQHRYAPVLLDDFAMTVPAGGSNKQTLSAHTILPTALAAHLAFGTELVGYEVRYQDTTLPTLSATLSAVCP